MVQIGKNEGEKKAKFASVPPGKSIETITLQEALAAFEGPRVVGEYKGEKVTAATGKFGPYVKYGNTYVSIRKDSGLAYTTISLEEAIPLIEAKLEVDKNKHINAFDYNGKKIEVLNGMYGPYIKYGGYNYRLPKGGKDATDLTLEDCVAIVDKKNGGANSPVETKHASSKEKTKPATKKTTKAPTKKAKK
jgi:DNA topoisomerase-1